MGNLYASMVTLRRIVAHYKRFRQERARHELYEFQCEASLKMAVERASLAEWPSGIRFSHQRRIPAATLAECKRRLMQRVRGIRSCESYEELHDFIAATVSGIYRAGPLYIYDTALRIGAKLGLAPKLVYKGQLAGAPLSEREESQCAPKHWRKTCGPQDQPKGRRRAGAC